MITRFHHCLSSLLMVVIMAGLLMADEPRDGRQLLASAFEIDLKSQSRQDFKNALTKYELAQESFEKTNNFEGQLRALDGRAWILALFGENSKARELYLKKLSISNELGDTVSAVESLYALGIVNTSLSDYSEGVNSYNKALEMLSKTQDIRAQGAIYSGMAEIHRQSGQYPAALEMLNKSLEISHNQKDVPGQVIDLLNLGRLYMDIGYPDEAARFLMLHLEALNTLAKDFRIDMSNDGMARVCLQLANYCRGLNPQSGRREIRRPFSDVFIEDVSLETFSVKGPQGDMVLYRRLGETDQALHTYQWTFEIQKKIGAQAGQSMTLNNLGLIHRIRGEFAKALECFEQSLEISARMECPYAQAVTLSNMGKIYVAWGNNQKARELFERSLSIREKIGSRAGVAQIYSQLGDLMRNWGLYPDALQYYAKCYAIYEASGQTLAMGDTLIRQGLALNGLDRNQQAFTELEKGLSLVRIAKGYENWPCDIIGNLYLDMGDLAHAQEYISRGGFYSSMARMALANSDLSSARKNYLLLLENSEKDGNADNLFVALTGLGVVSEKSGDLTGAMEFYTKALNLTEELRDGLLPSERSNFYDHRMGGFYRSEPAKGLVRVLTLLNRPLESINAAETIRARSFADNLSVRRLENFEGVPEDVLSQEDESTSRLASLKKRLLGIDKTSERHTWEKVSLEIRQARARMDSFIEYLWNNYRPYAQIKYPRPVSLPESGLKPDETTIVFDVVGDMVVVKLIKGRELTDSYHLEWKESELVSDVNGFRESFDTVNLRNFDVDLAKKLYHRLLEPVLSKVPKGTKLTIVPDGILSILPFEALVTQGNAEWRKGIGGYFPYGVTYLADDYPISYQQSLTSLSISRQKTHISDKTGNRLLVIADPVFQLTDQRAQKVEDQRLAGLDNEVQGRLMAAIEDFAGGYIKFDRLPQTGALAQNLSRLYPGLTDLFTGFEASKKVFLENSARKMSQYDKIIFATHGLFNDRIPGISEPFLALSMLPQGANGFLTMTDVMTLKADLSVVALTACQTGLGKNQTGEGVMSMGRAFQYIGARSVLMSLWSVAEKSSVTLVEIFFKNLKQGKDKLTCLDIARKEVRNQGFEHPFFWAAFVLLGEAM